MFHPHYTLTCPLDAFVFDGFLYIYLIYKGGMGSVNDKTNNVDYGTNNCCFYLVESIEVNLVFGDLYYNTLTMLYCGCGMQEHLPLIRNGCRIFVPP
jgi:hypothetical protein